MCGVVKSAQKSLEFSGSTSYISFSKDMAEVQDAVSVCTWFKKQKVGKGTLLYYRPEGQSDSIAMSDDLDWSYVVSNYASYSGEAVARDVWYHTCLTWSRATRTIKRYMDGKNVAESTYYDDRYIHKGSSIFIGKHSSNRGDGFIGEMAKFFIFKKCLNDAEVKELYSNGVCGTERLSNYFSENVFVSWDYILNSSPKNGGISTIDLGCEEPTKPQPTESQPTQTTKPLPTELTNPQPTDKIACKSHWNILFTEDFFNMKVTDEIIGKLLEPWKILFEFQGHTIDEALVNHLRKHHSLQESGCSDLA